VLDAPPQRFPTPKVAVEDLPDRPTTWPPVIMPLADSGGGTKDTEVATIQEASIPVSEAATPTQEASTRSQAAALPVESSLNESCISDGNQGVDKSNFLRIDEAERTQCHA
jgi:hypothetical protein